MVAHGWVSSGHNGRTSNCHLVGVAKPSAKLEQTQLVQWFGANPLSGLCLVLRTQRTPLDYAAVLA